jgi:hypothetical protein
MIGQVFILLLFAHKEVADGCTGHICSSSGLSRLNRNPRALGSYMLKFVEDQLLLRGYTTVRLNVAQDNPKGARSV